MAGGIKLKKGVNGVLRADAARLRKEESIRERQLENPRGEHC